MQFLPFILETKSFIRVKTLYKFCKEEKRLWSVGGSLFKFNAFKQTYISGKFPLVKVLISCQTNKLIFQKRQKRSNHNSLFSMILNYVTRVIKSTRFVTFYTFTVNSFIDICHFSNSQ